MEEEGLGGFSMLELALRPLGLVITLKGFLSVRIKSFSVSKDNSNSVRVFSFLITLNPN
jgi:hypothetical protein